MKIFLLLCCSIVVCGRHHKSFALVIIRCAFIFNLSPDEQFKQDSENDHIYHSELFTLTKRMAQGESQKLSFTVPIFEPHPPQYYIRAVSDSWLHAEAFYTISFHNLALPEVHIFFSSYYFENGWMIQLFSFCMVHLCSNGYSHTKTFLFRLVLHTQNF